jgi:hypothetical protein
LHSWDRNRFFIAQLLTKNLIFFEKVVDEERLSTIDPAGQCNQNEPERVQKKVIAAL